MTIRAGSMRFIESLGRSIHEATSVTSSSPDARLDAEARQLAAGVRRGDEAAFQELYNRYQDRLFRFGLVLARGNETLAGDMVQSVFVIAAAKLRTVESEHHLWNWLALVGRQQIQKFAKQQHKSVAALAAALPNDSPADPNVDNRLEDVLDAAMAELDIDDRALIEWFYFDGLSHQQIAEKAGATTKAISSRLERTRAWLRRRVQRALSCEH